jgi:riboflavin kinase / FMN adenylyltransferase
VQRWFGIDDIPPISSAVAIGVFDGVHRGHRRLIREALSRAGTRGLNGAVLTFDPNPAEVVAPQPPLRLSTLPQRLDLFDSLGVDTAVVLPFDRDISQMSPRHFFDDVLVGALGAKVIVVGENFRFGYRASGTIDTLTEFGADNGIDVVSLPLVRQRLVGSAQVPLSSTEIRALVTAGDVTAATRGLARPHRVEGEVVTGERRGRDLGYPTANLATTERAAIPADGVYAGLLITDPYTADRKSLPAAISVGTNPTFGTEQRRVEAYALDLPGDTDLYGQQVAVDFVARIRGQQAFGSADALTARMAVDVQRTRQLLGLS